MKHISPRAYFPMAVLVSLLFFCAAPPAFCLKDIPMMSKEELKSHLDDPDAVIIDARDPHDWDRSDSRIKGAVRLDPSNVEGRRFAYPSDKTIIVYCA